MKFTVFIAHLSNVLIFITEIFAGVLAYQSYQANDPLYTGLMLAYIVLIQWRI